MVNRVSDRVVTRRASKQVPGYRHTGDGAEELRSRIKHRVQRFQFSEPIERNNQGVIEVTSGLLPPWGQDHRDNGRSDSQAHERMT